MLRKLSVTIEGEEISDLELALDEVKKKVSEEYIEGYDRNETGSYFFAIAKEE